MRHQLIRPPILQDCFFTRAPSTAASPFLSPLLSTQGSWVLFDFQITLPFVVGVGLVILSIFIYGSKPEQIQPAIENVKRMVGIAPRKEYHLVAQMEPLVPDEEAHAPADRTASPRREV